MSGASNGFLRIVYEGQGELIINGATYGTTGAASPEISIAEWLQEQAGDETLREVAMSGTLSMDPIEALMAELVRRAGDLRGT